VRRNTADVMVGDLALAGMHTRPHLDAGLAGGAALEFPMTTARREPAASSTARKSSARCCTVGTPATGSDSPVPGLSNNRRRPIDASRRRNSVA
jgi:hypothetical protein